jgi:proteasome lid subunit RPN8/RPN11
VVERDIIEPHNLARHAARFDDIGSGKAAWAKAFGESVGISAGDGTHDLRGTGNQLWVRGHALDVVTTSDERLNQAFLTTTAVLDATANPQVRTRLCALPFSRRQLRAEMFDGGRLGVLTIGSLTSSPDPFDLYFWLCMLHQQDGAVRSWLAGERSGSLGLDEVVVGFGCASATVKLPKWAVDQHATAFMPTLVDVLRDDGGAFDGAGIGISSLDDELRPLGWRWYEAPVFDDYRLEELRWSLRISQTVIKEIRRLRESHLPAETGGYLFGGWDHVTRRMTVVAATPAPPNSRGTPSDLDLAGVEHCPVAQALIRRTAGRLHLVGSWHSHPDDCKMASAKDLLTVSAMVVENTIRGIPTLMLIQSDTAVPTIALSPG